MNLLDLPDQCLESILLWLNYDEIAKAREVCRRFDEINRNLLNRGFVLMTRRHAMDLKKVKARLPRRESERRHHALAKHSDVLTCIETRLSMLTMTYTKFMDLDLCCFIPGRVIDEVLSILRLVGRTREPLRAHEVLQELRDISSMATDHFDDEIAPHLKQKYIAEQQAQQAQQQTSAHGSSPSREHHSYSYIDRSLTEKLVPLPEVKKCEHAKNSTLGCGLAQANRLAMQKLESSYKQALKKARAMVQIQSKQLLQMKNYTVEMHSLKGQVTDLKKRLEEYEVKNREMSATISQMKSGGDPNVASSRTSNIKPRSATIILKRRIEEPLYGDVMLKKPKTFPKSHFDEQI